jgi:hypothetical protein
MDAITMCCTREIVAKTVLFPEFSFSPMRPIEKRTFFPKSPYVSNTNDLFIYGTRM